MLPEPFTSLPDTSYRQKHYLAGEYLFHMGDMPDTIYLVLSGEVHLQRYTDAGDLIIIHRAFPESYFAEASLFSDSYHCDAIIETEASVVAINKHAILNLMDNDPSFALKVTAYFARQVQDYRRLLELRSIKSAKDRVLAGLHEGWHKGSIISFAAQLGLTHEATYRALNELVRTGRAEKISRGDYRLSRQ
jgi:CRP-like cAMP-binding protein